MCKKRKNHKKMKRNGSFLIGNSNLLKVKYPKRFKKICKEFRFKVIKYEEFFCFEINPKYGFNWIDTNSDKYNQSKYPTAIEILAETIEDNEVLVFYYLCSGDDFPFAEAIAINNKGEKINTNFDDVFEIAHNLVDNLEPKGFSLNLEFIR